MYSFLLPFVSVAFMLFAAAEILIPFLNRKRDLVNFYTFFLFGSMVYVGVSGFDSALNPRDFRGASEKSFLFLELGILLFYGVLSITYRSVGTFDGMARRWSRRIPAISRRNWLSFAIPCGAFFLLKLLVPYGFVFSYASAILSQNALTICAVLLFAAASKKRGSAIWPVFLLVFVVCLYYSVTGGAGRRRLVSCMAIFPAAYYWLRFRQPGDHLGSLNLANFAQRITRTKSASRSAIVFRLSLVGVVIVLLLNGYSGTRYRFKAYSLERNFQYHMQSLVLIPKHMLRFPDTSQMLGQHAVRLSLTIIDSYYINPNDRFQISHFHTPFFVAANPIPRSQWPKRWPDKPESLGNTYPRDAGYWSRGYVNVGPGIVGQCFHEGGWHILLIYGMIAGISLRFLDQLLIHENSRGLMAALLAASAGPLMGMSRGCIAVFSVEFVASIATLVLVWMLGVFIQRVFPG